MMIWSKLSRNSKLNSGNDDTKNFLSLRERREEHMVGTLICYFMNFIYIFNELNSSDIKHCKGLKLLKEYFLLPVRSLVFFYSRDSLFIVILGDN